MGAKFLKLVSFFILTLSVSACEFFSDCGNNTRWKIPSPEGKRVAHVFERNCGVASNSNTQISIIAPDSEETETGNILIVGDGLNFSTPEKPVWESENRLLVSLPKGVKIYRQVVRDNGIEIVYKLM